MSVSLKIGNLLNPVNLTPPSVKDKDINQYGKEFSVSFLNVLLSNKNLLDEVINSLQDAMISKVSKYEDVNKKLKLITDKLNQQAINWDDSGDDLMAYKRLTKEEKTLLIQSLVLSTTETVGSFTEEIEIEKDSQYENLIECASDSSPLSVQAKFDFKLAKPNVVSLSNIKKPGGIFMKPTDDYHSKSITEGSLSPRRDITGGSSPLVSPRDYSKSSDYIGSGTAADDQESKATDSLMSKVRTNQRLQEILNEGQPKDLQQTNGATTASSKPTVSKLVKQPSNQTINQDHSSTFPNKTAPKLVKQTSQSNALKNLLPSNSTMKTFSTEKNQNVVLTKPKTPVLAEKPNSSSFMSSTADLSAKPKIPQLSQSPISMSSSLPPSAFAAATKLPTKNSPNQTTNPITSQVRLIPTPMPLSNFAQNPTKSSTPPVTNSQYMPTPRYIRPNQSPTITNVVKKEDEDLKLKVSDLNSKAVVVEQKLDELTKIAIQLDNKNLQLMMKNKDLNAKNTQSQDKITELDKMLHEMSQKMSELNTKNKTLVEKYQRKKQQKKMIKRRLKELQNTKIVAPIEPVLIKKPEEENPEKINEIVRELNSTWNEKVGELSNTIKEISSKNAELDRKNSDLQAIINEITAESKEIKQKNATLDGKLQKKITKNANLKERIKQSETDKQQSISKGDEYKSRCSELLGKNEELMQVKEDLTQRLEEAKLTIEDMRLNNNDLQDRNDDLVGKCEELVAKCEELAGKCEELSTKCEEYSSQVAELSGKNAQLYAKNKEILTRTSSAVNLSLAASAFQLAKTKSTRNMAPLSLIQDPSQPPELQQQASMNQLVQLQQQQSMNQLVQLQQQQSQAQLTGLPIAPSTPPGAKKPESSLLTQNYFSYLHKYIEEAIGKKRWKLVYRATRDGFQSIVFHGNCDNLEVATICLIKTSNGSIFGGFTTKNWKSDWVYVTDPNAFIFSLQNGPKEGVPQKYSCIKSEKAIYCASNFGPVFGGGYDICIANECNENQESWSNVGHTYNLKGSILYDSDPAKTLLCGAQKFKVSELEVFALV